VYGNLDNWIARGAAEQEFVLQGPLQMGYFGGTSTPFIIGSHCTYRTEAILAINGFQPTRAEDHLDTVMMAARSWRGVFVPEVIAVGGGPDTFETYLRQQFAWAYSMIQVLFQFTPKLVGKYPPNLRVQFLFAQTWYPLWSTAMVGLFLSPVVALLTGTVPATVSFVQFLLFSSPAAIVAFLAWRFSRAWHVPKGLSLSWRGVVLHIARWPIVFWALVNVIFRVKHPYMITPKQDDDGVPTASFRSQAIYLVLALILAGTVGWVIGTGKITNATGYILFGLLGGAWMLVVVGVNWATAAFAMRDRGIGFFKRMKATRAIWAPFLASVAVFAGTIWGARTFIAETVVPAPDLTDLYARETRSRMVRWLGGARPIETGQNMPSSLVLPARGAPWVGAYDPNFTLYGEGNPLRSWYVRQDDSEYFARVLDYAAGRFLPMITIEPYGEGDVLARVTSGGADDEIRAMAKAVAARPLPQVLIRWGHEMDLSLLYPWSDRDPATYRTAYRRVVSIFRAEGATAAQFVWSPAGEAVAVDYYPGDDVVDQVGVTVLADEQWEALAGLPSQSFVDIFGPRYARLAPFGKPMMIAELGVSGSNERQRSWLDAAAASICSYPQLRSMVYFQERNAENQRFGIRPDWSVSDATFRQFFDRVSATVCTTTPAV
jgi:hypothetical protein